MSDVSPSEGHSKQHYKSEIFYIKEEYYTFNTETNLNNDFNTQEQRTWGYKVDEELQ